MLLSPAALGCHDTTFCHGLQSLSADHDQSRLKSDDKLSLQPMFDTLLCNDH